LGGVGCAIQVDAASLRIRSNTTTELQSTSGTSISSGSSTSVTSGTRTTVSSGSGTTINSDATTIVNGANVVLGGTVGCIPVARVGDEAVVAGTVATIISGSSHVIAC
jgi:activator of HSP90 ATPase